MATALGELYRVKATKLNLRREPANLDDEAIARSLESMKRLWVNQGVDGLLRRREAEAALVRSAMV